MDVLQNAPEFQIIVLCPVTSKYQIHATAFEKTVRQFQIIINTYKEI